MAESIKNLLAVELEAIQARLGDAKTADAKRLAAQFGERVAHLKERLAACPEPPPPEKPKAPAKAG